MIEALTDPKTWLFALFAIFDNIPNSLTNQIQIIVSSLGFTPFQTTLLGCVGGVVEIVTIFTGVKIASRFQNGRAWVAIAYFVPNVLAAILVNVLPWHDKVGLLFSFWLAGTHDILRMYITHVSGITGSGVGTTGFVLALVWVSQTTAGHTKRVTTNAIMLSAYCIGNAAGPFMWQAKYKPR
jgi:MFS transporter, ACS family, allantoate permease